MSYRSLAIFGFIAFFVFFSGCTSIENKTESERSSAWDNPIKNNKTESANAYGWSESNCAHITADGKCAHQIGPNPFSFSGEGQADGSTSSGPNGKVLEGSDCAHVATDGSCLHKL